MNERFSFALFSMVVCYWSNILYHSDTETPPPVGVPFSFDNATIMYVYVMHFSHPITVIRKSKHEEENIRHARK